jgi:hypothetical protein
MAIGNIGTCREDIERLWELVRTVGQAIDWCGLPGSK